MSSNKNETILKILKDASNKLDAQIGMQLARRDRSLACTSSAYQEEVPVENVPSTAEETASFAREVLDAENLCVVAEEVIVTVAKDVFDPVTCAEALLDPMQEAARYFEDLGRAADEDRHFDEWIRAGDQEAFASSSWEPYQILPTEAASSSQTGITDTWPEYYRSPSATPVQALEAYSGTASMCAGTKRVPTQCDGSTCDAKDASPANKRVRL
ncbi:hypothetical protein AAVH_03517 [Aphelenchoides avenae]|nr:hypothetical protein AAVH_03517 [Aphelenchus avenae]